jgi:predicted unusual protein kinase regulating ubiquinone biosynthesis (AarF/ABC1/UbiB family)
MFGVIKQIFNITKILVKNVFLYKIKHITKHNCLVNITQELSKYNILYSKFFQIISSENKLLDKDSIDILIKYNDSIKYDNEEIINIDDLVEDLNTKFNDDKIIYNKKPIKSGLISIIYQGLLNDNEIIIKVIRKNIKNRLENDYNEIENLVYCISRLPYINNLNINDYLEENKQIILNQTNFIEENKNCIQFYNNYKNIDYIKIPKVYEKYTNYNNSIIVMERIRGETLYTILNNKELELDRFGLLLTKFTIKCILYDRLYHSDLHSGNIFFINENGNYKLGIIDFGIVNSITKEEQNLFYLFMKGIFKNNSVLETRLFLINNLIEPFDTYKNLNKYIKNDIMNNMDVIIEKYLIFSECISYEWIYLLNKMFRKYNMHVSKKFCKILLSLVICDSVGKNLCIDQTNNEKIISSIDDLFNTNVLDY